MAQIQAGVTYADGGQVTAANLNAHVNNAVLVPGAINTQPQVAASTTSDILLCVQSGALKQMTLAQAATAINPSLTPYLPRDGSQPMTGELTLSNSLPTADLSAASKGYVDTGLATKQNTLTYTPANKAGDTFTGPVVLNADPSVALGAATKQYVDAADALKASLSGATFTGPVVLATSPTVALGAATKGYVDDTTIPRGGANIAGTYVFGRVQTSNIPSTSTDVITKSYLDGLIATSPRLVASAYFYNATVPGTTVDTSRFLTVIGSRTAGSSEMTISYGSLPSRYYDSANPFFFATQYIGINTGTAGVTGRLYQITSANLAARTFTITTPETTAFSGSVQLSLVYDSTNLKTNEYGYNVKSIYMDMTAISKYYVNYINDIVTNQPPTLAITTPVRCDQVSGSANLYQYAGSLAYSMRDVGRTTYLYNQDIPEGFGSTRTGSHIGFFYTYGDGVQYPLWAASFAISAVLPPSVTP
jgi:hypothetical protein